MMKNTHAVLLSTLIFCSVAISSLQGQWTQLPSPQIPSGSVWHVQLGKKIFASSEFSTAYTTNYGITWKSMFVDSNIIRFFVSDGSRLCAITQRDVFCSTDEGSTWTKGNGLPKNTSNVLWITSAIAVGRTLYASSQVYDSASSSLFRSNDGGVHWTEVSTPMNGKDISSIGFYKSFLYCSCGSEMFRMDTSGAAGEIFSGPNDNGVSVFATLGSELYAGSFSGLYKLTSDEKQWTKVAIDTKDHWISDLSVEGNSIYVGTINGLFCSTDAGITWKQELSFGQLEIYNVFASSSSVAVSCPDGLFIRMPLDTAWKRMDYFKKTINPSSVYDYYGSFLVFGRGLNTTYVFTSSDAGEHWTRLDWGLFDIQQLFVKPGFLLVSTRNFGLALSTDSGKQWRYNDAFDGTLYEAKSKWYSIVGKSVFRSDDTGMTWVDISPTSPEIAYSFGAIGDSIILIGEFAMFFSTDEGNTWKSTAKPVGTSYGGSVNNNAIYFWNWTNRVMQILRTESPILETPPLLQQHNSVSLRFFGDIVIAEYWDTVALSTNNGRTWVQLPEVPAWQNGYLVKDSILYISTNNGIWKYDKNILDVPRRMNGEPLDISVYPNLVSATTTISFALNKPEVISLVITDILGRRIRTIANGKYGGPFSTVVACDDLPNGAYYIRLQVGDNSIAKPISIAH